MASVGFAGALGNQAMADQIRQALIDKLNQQEKQHGMSTQDQELALKSRALDQQDVLTRLKIQEMADAKKAAEQDQQFKIGTTLSNTIPAGSILPPESPAIGPLNMLGALKEQSPTLPSTSYIGTQTTAPQPEAPGSTIRGTLQMAQNAGNPRQFIKLPSQAEQAQASTASERQRMDEARIEQMSREADIRTQLANQAGATAEAKAAAAASQLALQQAKLDLAREQAGQKSEDWSPLPGGQLVRDPVTGNYGYPFANKKGETRIVPLPAGASVEKPTTPGLITQGYRALFGTGNENQPQISEWVRDSSGRLVKKQ